jgi:hypothetical protein
MMVLWILILPGSWLFGRSQRHEQLMEPIIEKYMRHGIVPPEIITKYRGEKAVHLTHVLPAAIWAILIPFQLHRRFRKDHPNLHRWMGYIFFSSGFLLAIGVGIILRKDLYFENFFDDLPPLPFTSEPLIISMAVYFFLSAVYSLKLAIDGQHWDHQKWIIRHIASGLWVAIQRFLLATLFSTIFPQPVARTTQRLSFSAAGTIAMVTSIACGEYAIQLTTRETQKMKATAKKQV